MQLTKNKRIKKVMDNITTLDATQFKDSVFITIALRGISFKKQIRDQGKLEAYLAIMREEVAIRDASGQPGSSSSAVSLPSGFSVAKGSKKAVGATKTLLFSPALDALREHLSMAKAKIVAPPQYGGIANPSGLMEGLFELHKDLVTRVNTEIEEAKRRLTESWLDDAGAEKPGFLAAFLDDYDQAIERARTAPLLEGGLGPLFNINDYPSRDKVSGAFDIQRRWIALGVPEGLPESLREQAAEELKADLRNAAEQIKASMREGFLQLLEHAKEVLTVKPGEKAKIVKESCIANVIQFCEVFNLRNTQGDAELAALVEEAKLALVQMDPKEIRKDTEVRAQAAQAFTDIVAKVDAMITTQKGRVFDFGDE
jgi:hypothetical protein